MSSGAPVSAQPPPGRLGVGVVGAGRVGAVLASALRAAGHAVVGASAVSAESRDRVDALLPGVPILDVPDIVERAELVLLTVPDDALPELVTGLAALGAFQPGQLVVHTAGRYGIDVLAPARAAGAIPLAIHPAMTFTGSSVDLARIVGAPFAVTAPGPVLPIAQALVVEIGGEPVVLPETSRGLYHAALAHGANHLVTLTAQAIRVLAAAGVPDGGALLTPLLHAALDGALRAGDAALTGPVARGDAGTLSAHLGVLTTAGTPEDDLADVPATYAALSRATVQRALVTRRLTEPQAQGLLDVLEPSSVVGPERHEPPPEAAPDETRLVHTVADLREAIGPDPKSWAVVMTMGALHEGHLSLVRLAQARAARVVVTIFVNPLQFGAGEDLDRYPRTPAEDLEKLRAEGVDLVFAPDVTQIYPSGAPIVRVSAGAMGEVLEGAVRPGHFDGMLTVVNKLMHVVGAGVAVFGQKDAQQLALIRRMVADLTMDIEVVAGPTVREADGLARSSRNIYLTGEQRAAALVLSASVHAGERAARHGADPAGVLAAARAVLATHDREHVQPDYLELVDPTTMAAYSSAVEDTAAPAGLLVIAARVGSTRLIDNAVIDWAPAGAATATQNHPEPKDTL